jgi:lipopolysaccharide/colanic/teichoic acid biosynthesis glycosyltransferase
MECTVPDCPGGSPAEATSFEQLWERYGAELPARRRLARHARVRGKRWTWYAVVHGAGLLKRLMDITAALVLLVLLAPLLAVVAVCIKCTDGGPVLFWQTRIGQWGREFAFPKFRSMVMNAESLKDQLVARSDHADQRTFKMKRDPRVTWIGRIIRKLSIDELPQLWNVLVGQMALVGPRPPVPREVAQYTLQDRRRLDVKPGLTCLWQIGGRADIPFPQQVQLDIQYIESRSLRGDVGILLKTIPAVLLGRGAY